MEDIKWFFSEENLARTPSIIQGMDKAEEMVNRKLAAYLIHDLTGLLKLSQICLNTAVMYMHRFYMFHSFTEVDKYSLSIGALFLAAKLNEEYRVLDRLILYAHHLIGKTNRDLCPVLDTDSEEFALKREEIVLIESLLLFTFGFQLTIERPHTHILRICQIIEVRDDLAKSAFLLATISQCTTTLSLQFSPEIIACLCFHLVCEWRGYKTKSLPDGKEWFSFINKHITLNLLNELAEKLRVALSEEPRFFRENIPSN